MKVAAQKQALDRLHSTVVRQRFALRVQNELRDPITRDEWIKARDAITDEQTRDRIGDPV
jgi:uncharacterized coiled-coil protein SlyX